VFEVVVWANDVTEVSFFSLKRSPPFRVVRVGAPF
jgi:hypothetical protein